MERGSVALSRAASVRVDRQVPTGGVVVVVLAVGTTPTFTIMAGVAVKVAADPVAEAAYMSFPFRTLPGHVDVPCADDADVVMTATMIVAAGVVQVPDAIIATIVPIVAAVPVVPTISTPLSASVSVTAGTAVPAALIAPPIAEDAVLQHRTEASAMDVDSGDVAEHVETAPTVEELTAAMEEDAATQTATAAPTAASAATSLAAVSQSMHLSSTAPVDPQFTVAITAAPLAAASLGVKKTRAKLTIQQKIEHDKLNRSLSVCIKPRDEEKYISMSTHFQIPRLVELRETITMYVNYHKLTTVMMHFTHEEMVVEGHMTGKSLNMRDGSVIYWSDK